MKIIFLTPEYPPYIGGISNVTQELAQELSIQGHQVFVVTRNLCANKTKENIKGVQIIRIPRLFRCNVYLDYLLVSAISFWHTLKIKPEVCHAQSILPFGLVSALYSKINKNTISIVQAHGKDIGRELVKSKILSPFSKIALKNNNIVLAVSNYHAKIVKKFTNKTAQILPNGINKINLDKTKISLQKKHHLNNKKTNILFVGRLIKQKGVHILLKSIKELENTTAHIIGEGPEKDNLLSLVKKLLLEKRVVFHGNLNRGTVFEFMKASDIFVFPVKDESFGLVLLEAMQLDIPIICPKGEDIGGPTEIIHDKENGILTKRDELNFKKSIELIQNEEELVKKITKKAKKDVSSKYFWKPIVQKYINIIESYSKTNNHK